MKSNFEATKKEKVYCPKCNKQVYLLSAKDIKDTPKFYICFDCKYIGQVGVGKVEVTNN
ncbi:hypothetical protein [Vallitalea guaymasensis]|uniref:hypothetical protein n=1 Tax=Vallitalea guaymasensis TaxID=1185412 RepID=UPI00187D3F6E|nr:hypothetical protein [Vallitalea guaymasensis]